MKKKKLIIIIGVIAAGGIGYGLYNYFGNKSDKEKADAAKAAALIAAGGVPPTVTGGGSGLDYNTLSQNLFDAFNGYGTDNTAVEAVFKKLQNQADLSNLIATYGARVISSGFGNIFNPDFTGNLFETIKNEMSASEINKLNTILAQKGITTKIL